MNGLDVALRDPWPGLPLHRLGDRSSTILAEHSTPGRPAPGCVPAPTK